MSKTLSHHQMLKYNRHIALPAMDLEGQERLLNAHVVIIGLGGLGCAVAPYLTAAGIGKITLVDDDVIDRHNLQRQILFTENSVGKNKAEQARQHLVQLNSEADITALPVRADDALLMELAEEATLIVDCCDNLATRNSVNKACLKSKTPLVSGSAIRFEGQIASFSMQNSSPCYACYSQFFGEQQLSCTEAGVLSPLVGVVGTMQAVEAIKIAAGIGQPLYSSVLLFDALHSDWQRLNIQKHPQCPHCADL
ncbi:HesA/MoeB/ThiF family protein [Idiomarina abyssalis]|jgi:adenylyltransferase/sulfurtransferase|uniref:HesA/MoeB/ThiF family protein n=1 Tax=Idiomarina abyssalis TaxID=86102 RepID=UPI003A93BB5F|tara:strand:+ start:3836 stop:4591 length:756 start_codon:yes stop_codon:yes gene_type:complete